MKKETQNSVDPESTFHCPLEAVREARTMGKRGQKVWKQKIDGAAETGCTFHCPLEAVRENGEVNKDGSEELVEKMRRRNVNESCESSTDVQLEALWDDLSRAEAVRQTDGHRNSLRQPASHTCALSQLQTGNDD